MHRSSSPPPAGGPELCLRFECQGCRDLLLIPVENLRRSHCDRCPKCHQPVEFPVIDDSTAGYRHIVPKVRAKKVDCPNCATALQVPPTPPGSRQQCPACQIVLLFQLVPQLEPQPQAPRTSSNPRPEDVSNERSADRIPSPSSRPTHCPVPPPANQSASTSDPAPSPVAEESPKPVDAAMNVAVVKPKALANPVVYGGQVATSSAGSGRLDLSSSPRLTSWLIYPVIHILLPLAITCVCMFWLRINVGYVAVSLATISCAWLILGFRWSRSIAIRLSTLVVDRFKCPGCAEESPAVSQWKCGCGYNDHRERHALSFRCPKCSKVLGYLDCEQCGSTIIIR